jgi:hypothetical protein
MRALVNQAWEHGTDGYWDRVSALRRYIAATGGIGKPTETPAVVQARRERIELVMISWARQASNDHAAYAFNDTRTGEPLEQERMHYQIHLALDQYPFVDIAAYRGSGKTTQVAEIKPLHVLGHNSSALFRLVSEGSDTAVMRVRNSRNHIDQNARHRMVFPGLRPAEGMPWNDEAYTVARQVIAKDASFSGGGYNAAVVGGRCTHLLGDDVVPPSAITSVTDRATVELRWENVWTKMLFSVDPHIWYPHTPWHELDLSAKINKSAAYRHLRFAVGGPEGCLACPDHGGKRCGIPFHNPWAPRHDPPSALRQIYLRDGSLSYSRSHLLIPIASETSLFPGPLFANGIKRPDLVLRRPWRWWAEHGIRIVFGVDLAIGAGTGADFTVIYVLGFDAKGTRYTIDIIRHKTDDYRVQRQLVIDAYAKYRPDLIYIEATQYQRVFTSLLAHTTSMPVKPFYPLGTGKARRVEGAEKRDLKFGVPGLRIYFENQRWYFPYGDEYSQEMIDLHIDELQHFALTAEGKVEGVGAHDDTVTSGWIASCAALKLGADLSDDLGDGLEGIEDLPPAAVVPKLPALGEFVPLAPGAGQAVQAPVPRQARPHPKAYDAIYGVLVNLDGDKARRGVGQLGAQLEGLVQYLEGVKEAPDPARMMRMGFAPRIAGTISGLCSRQGWEEVLYVLRDLRQEHVRRTTGGDRFALARATEELEGQLYEGEGWVGGKTLDELSVPGALDLDQLLG